MGEVDDDRGDGGADGGEEVPGLVRGGGVREGGGERELWRVEHGDRGPEAVLRGERERRAGALRGSLDGEQHAVRVGGDAGGEVLRLRERGGAEHARPERLRDVREDGRQLDPVPVGEAAGARGGGLLAEDVHRRQRVRGGLHGRRDRGGGRDLLHGEGLRGDERAVDDDGDGDGASRDVRRAAERAARVLRREERDDAGAGGERGGDGGARGVLAGGVPRVEGGLRGSCAERERRGEGGGEGRGVRRGGRGAVRGAQGRGVLHHAGVAAGEGAVHAVLPVQRRHFEPGPLRAVGEHHDRDARESVHGSGGDAGGGERPGAERLRAAAVRRRAALRDGGDRGGQGGVHSCGEHGVSAGRGAGEGRRGDGDGRVAGGGDASGGVDAPARGVPGHGLGVHVRGRGAGGDVRCGARALHEDDVRGVGGDGDAGGEDGDGALRER